MLNRHRNRSFLGHIAWLPASLLLLFAAACGGGGEEEPGAATPGFLTAPPAQITVSSPDFRGGENIPRQFTCDGEDLSPEVEWGGLPPGAQSVALIVDDPDAPRGIFTHWVLYNLPPEPRRVPRGVPDTERLENGADHGVNDFGDTGYGGPCPPQGPAHEYRFMVFASKAPLALEPGASAEEALAAMQGSVVGLGSLSGMYARQ